MRKRRPMGESKKTCSKCNEPLEPQRIGKQRYCLSCHRVNMKKHNKENPKPYSEFTDEQKKKDIARSYLGVYIRRGKVIKLPCQKCGDENSEAHHHDYDKPLEVEWLCRKHHMEKHGR